MVRTRLLLQSSLCSLFINNIHTKSLQHLGQLFLMPFCVFVVHDHHASKSIIWRFLIRSARSSLLYKIQVFLNFLLYWKGLFASSVDLSHAVLHASIIKLQVLGRNKIDNWKQIYFILLEPLHWPLVFTLISFMLKEYSCTDVSFPGRTSNGWCFFRHRFKWSLIDFRHLVERTQGISKKSREYLPMAFFTEKVVGEVAFIWEFMQDGPR